MPSNRTLVIPALLAGIVLLMIAIVYLVDSAAGRPATPAAR